MNNSVRAESPLASVEKIGVDFLPEDQRTSTPVSAGLVLGGSYFSLITVIYGWISLALGLDFWDTLTSYVAGGLIGAVATYYLPLMGPLTGTNMTVASGAHFGIRGRFIGSVLVLGLALTFGAVAVWTSGDALVGAANRLLPVQVGAGGRALAYGLVAVGMAIVAIYGFDLIVQSMQFLVPVFALMMLVGVFAFAPDFDPSKSTGVYALGTFLPTWMLSAVFGIAGAVGSAATFGDYTRRISLKHGRRNICLTVVTAVFVGNVVPGVFGAFTAASFPTLGDSYVGDLMAYSPTWFLPAVIVMALAGGVSFGVLCIYSSGLDLEGLFTRLKRYQTTAITSAASIVLVYVGVFALDAVDSISAITAAITAVITPWVVILMLALMIQMVQGSKYDVAALHDFKSRTRHGVYWYTGGFNAPASLAYFIGAGVGLLGLNSQLYVGPLAMILDGVDVSIIGSAVAATLFYLLFRYISSLGGSPPSTRSVTDLTTPARARGWHS